LAQALRLLREESGYSLVEVMASIMILAIAILPMVGMFDMGLTSATRGSNYDKARALANKQLEQAQGLSYNTLRLNFPNAPCTFNPPATPNAGLCEATNLQDPDSEFNHLRYTIRKQYVNGSTFANAPDDTGMMKITVVVGWGGNNFDDTTYTATDIKTR
jgi:prepilin-type N-terminal cleavage/methylation domain-containing protein